MIPAATHEAAALVGRFFAGELPPEQWEPLLRHVDTCEACRAHFGTTRLALRALGGGPVDAAAAVLSGADGELIGRLLSQPGTRQRRFRAAWRAGLAVALAAGAVAGLALLVGRGDGERSPVAEVAERGGVAAAHPGFDVLCLPADEAGKAVSSRESGGRCGPDSYLKVMVTSPGTGTPNGDFRHATVVAVDRAGRLRFVTRAPIGGQASQILPGHDRLGAGDRLFFQAVFSKQSIGDETVRRALEQARASGAPPGAPLSLSGLSLTHELEANR